MRSALDGESEAPLKCWLYHLLILSPAARHSNALDFNLVLYKMEIILYHPIIQKVYKSGEICQSQNHNLLFIRLTNIY